VSSVIQRSFAGGEIAPALHARADLARYAIGLKTCRNMVVMRAGGATKRPGTQFVMITGTTAPFTLTILPTTLALDASTTTGAVTATLLDSLGNPVTSRAVTWETDDGSVATVASTGSLTGLVTATGSGTTAIRARCAALGIVSNDCALTVDGTAILVVTASTTKSVNGTVTAYAVGGGGGGNASGGGTTDRRPGGGGGVSSANFTGTDTMTITVAAGGAVGADGSVSSVAMPGNTTLSVPGGEGSGPGEPAGASGFPTSHTGGSGAGVSNGTDGVGVAGGGGGANGDGANATLGGGFSGNCGDGGDGITLIHGSHVLGTFGGGGGGGASTIGAGAAVRGGGGTGGGGNGAVNGVGIAGQPNTGGGGGNGAVGGSGVVLLVWDAFNTTVS
jgi:hypothetical protein